jgi:hypothetical protein
MNFKLVKWNKSVYKLLKGIKLKKNKKEETERNLASFLFITNFNRELIFIKFVNRPLL